MVLENCPVRHKAFGAGVVVACEGKYLQVRFGNAIRNFVYPDVFEKYMTLEDGTVSEQIQADITAARDLRARILAQKNEENQRAMTHGIVIPGKENAVGTEDEEEKSHTSDAEEI